MIGIYCDVTSIPGKTLKFDENMSQNDLSSEKDIICFDSIKYIVRGKSYQKVYDKEDLSKIDCYTIYLEKLNFLNI